LNFTQRWICYNPAELHEISLTVNKVIQL